MSIHPLLLFKCADDSRFDTLMTNMISACDLIKQAIPNVAKTFETLTTRYSILLTMSLHS